MPRAVVDPYSLAPYVRPASSASSSVSKVYDESVKVMLYWITINTVCTVGGTVWRWVSLPPMLRAAARRLRERGAHRVNSAGAGGTHRCSRPLGSGRMKRIEGAGICPSGDSVRA